jgi:hypothetical protein
MQPNSKPTELGDALNAQADLYDKAIQIAKVLETDANSSLQLADLQAVLDDIAAYGTSADDMQALSQDKRPVVRQQASVLQKKIETLLALIRSAEDRFREAKAKLLPQVQQEVTARKMLDAYGGQR